MSRLIRVVILVAFMLALSSCASSPASSSGTSPAASSGNAASGTKPAETAADSGWKIAVAGGAKDTTLTNADFQKIGIVSIKAAMKVDQAPGPEDECTGVPLAKVLGFVGAGQYTTVKVESADGTSREYTPDLVSASGTILGIEVNGKSLDKDRGPVQLVVSGKGSNWWIKQVSKITIIK